jgi:hypothetical protein
MFRTRHVVIGAAIALCVAATASSAGASVTRDPARPASASLVASTDQLSTEQHHRARLSRTTDAQIDAVPGLRSLLNERKKRLAAEQRPGPHSSQPTVAARADGATPDLGGFRWGDAALGAAGALLLGLIAALVAITAIRLRRANRQFPEVR